MKNRDGNSRRDFFKQAGGVLVAGVSLPVLSTLLTSCEQDEGGPTNIGTGSNANTIAFKDYPALNSVGGSVKRSFTGQNNGIGVIIVRLANDEFLVVSSECTHNGCIVGTPNKGETNLACPCHGAKFSSIDGSVVQKPNNGSDITGLKKFQYVFDKTKETIEIKF